MIDYIDNFNRKMLIKEYKKELKNLIHNLKYTFQVNPHNLFKGTAWQYINKYKINISLRNKLTQFWLK